MSAFFASLATGMILLGLTLRNQQLVTVAVGLFSFLTYAAWRASHADVAAAGQRLEYIESDETGQALRGLGAKRRLSSQRIFDDGEIDVELRDQNKSRFPKTVEVRD